jgi:hypothetical protein
MQAEKFENEYQQGKLEKRRKDAKHKEWLKSFGNFKVRADSLYFLFYNVFSIGNSNLSIKYIKGAAEAERLEKLEREEERIKR